MAAKEQAICQIFSFQDCKTFPDPIYELPAQFSAPIVIDNGSFQTRAGCAVPAETSDSPRLLFRSVAARSRGAARSETQIGNDIPNLEPLRWLLKSQFDRNVVVNFEIQELIFDYVFTHLGVASEVRGGAEVDTYTSQFRHHIRLHTDGEISSVLWVILKTLRDLLNADWPVVIS